MVPDPIRSRSREKRKAKTKPKVWAFAWGLAVAALVFLFSFTPGLENIEMRTLDYRLRLRKEKKANPEILIIEFDDASIEHFGRWPWPRGYHASLLHILAQFQPRAIGYDIIFSEPLLEHPEEDKLFAEETKKAGDVFFAAFFTLAEEKTAQKKERVDFSGKEEILAKYALPLSVTPKGFFQAEDVTLPLPELLEASAGFASVNSPPEPDGLSRSMPLLIEAEGKLYPTLPLSLAAKFFGAAKEEIVVQPGKYILIKGRKIPLDQKARLWLNFPGGFTSFPRLSFAQLAKSYDQICKNEKPLFDLTQIKDKIVLVGLTATGTSDLRSTAFSPLYPSVGLHAACLDNLLSQKFLRRLPKFFQFFLLVFLSLACALVLSRYSYRGLFYLLGLYAAYLLVAWLAFIYQNIWLELVSPSCVFLFTFISVTLNQFIVERFEKGLLEKELSLASQIQQGLLAKEMPKLAGLEIYAATVSAKYVGGDFYDAVAFSESQAGLLISDVTGKGVSAALYMAKALTDFRSQIDADLPPAQVMQVVNRKLVQESPQPGMFLTAIFLRVDLKQNLALFANAGHHPFLHFQQAAHSATYVQKKSGLPLGILAESVYSTESVKLSKGDLLVFYTDGVIEAVSRKGEEFGKERLVELVEANFSLSARALSEKIFTELKIFSKGALQHDDTTLLVAKLV
jgi:CHASE2 domain-containing sensor protein